MAGRGHYHPKVCKVCGKPNEDGSRVSVQGFCREHGKERMVANHEAMKTKRGPYAHWWAYRLAQSVGWAPLDEQVSRP